MAGYALGVTLPFGISKGADWFRKGMAARAADRGDQIMAGAGRGGWQTRAARVNEFWTTGGSPQQPFIVDRGQRGFELQ